MMLSAVLGGSATTDAALAVLTAAFVVLAAWTVVDYRAWLRERERAAAERKRAANMAREAWDWPRRPS